MTEDTVPLKTIVRAFDVLDILERKREAGPTEVARELGVTRSTAHDYLVTLEETGYVVNDEGSYRIGYRFLGRGNRLKYRTRLFSTARVVVEKLSAETDERAQLGVEESGDWILLHHESDVTSVNMGDYPGLRTPLHTHAAGKVLLTHLPDDRVEEILTTGELEGVTEHTVTDAAELRSELDRIAKDGYAVDWNEQVIGIGFVACPLVVREELVGSVSVGCPTGRLQDREYRDALIRHVKTAADEIVVNYRYKE